MTTPAVQGASTPPVKDVSVDEPVATTPPEVAENEGVYRDDPGVCEPADGYEPVGRTLKDVEQNRSDKPKTSEEKTPDPEIVNKLNTARELNDEQMLGLMKKHVQRMDNRKFTQRELDSWKKEGFEWGKNNWRWDAKDKFWRRDLRRGEPLVSTHVGDKRATKANNPYGATVDMAKTATQIQVVDLDLTKKGTSPTSSDTSKKTIPPKSGGFTLNSRRAVLPEGPCTPIRPSFAPLPTPPTTSSEPVTDESSADTVTLRFEVSNVNCEGSVIMLIDPKTGKPVLDKNGKPIIIKPPKGKGRQTFIATLNRGKYKLKVVAAETDSYKKAKKNNPKKAKQHEDKYDNIQVDVREVAKGKKA